MNRLAWVLAFIVSSLLVLDAQALLASTPKAAFGVPNNGFQIRISQVQIAPGTTDGGHLSVPIQLDLQNVGTIAVGVTNPITNQQVTVLDASGSEVPFTWPPCSGQTSVNKIVPQQNVPLIAPGGIDSETFNLACLANVQRGNTYAVSVLLYLHDAHYSATPIATLQSNTISVVVP